MLRTTKNMKEKYEKIQNYIFTLIPEKWDEIYLYASVVSNYNDEKSGELFFYYLPKGILKKRPINVYEVPQRFNINEEQYLKIVEELYKCIKSLNQDFIDMEQELWTNLTISIANFKFKVEYRYDDLPLNEEEINKRNIIWKYNYLKIGGESREERKILDEYFLKAEPIKKEIYETGLYIKSENNSIKFDKEESNSKEFAMYEKDEILNITNSIKNKIFSNSVFNKNEQNANIREEKECKEDKENKENKNEEKRSRNQILDN